MQKCPYLPSFNGVSGPEITRRHGDFRGEEFYIDALKYAHWHWVSGKPAQAILQINKAFSADLCGKEEVLRSWPWPYDALEWILQQSARGDAGFLGNPVRHFQHLATRMSGPRKEIRVRRAWACFWMARRVLGESGVFPMDGRQLAREGFFIFPDPGRV